MFFSDVAISPALGLTATYLTKLTIKQTASNQYAVDISTDRQHEKFTSPSGMTREELLALVESTELSQELQTILQDGKD